MAPRQSGFFSELKRRNVLRAVVLYVGAAWALSQGISQLSGPLGLAGWVTVWFLIACAIAFPFWVAFAWFYEFTPQGFRRDDDMAIDTPTRTTNARRLDRAIIVVLTVAVVLLGSGYFIRARTRPAGSTPFTPLPNSVAVLPLANLSDDPAQGYFSNGITEELTAALGRNPRLAVIGWQTASHLAGSLRTPEQIGKALNVATIVDGSVQRDHGRVRVSVELINARTGKQLWASHYDDTVENIFAVQDHITSAIAGALNVRFSGARAVPIVNITAHDLYLRGLAAMDHFTAQDTQAAQDYFRQALQLDPDYADAWAGMAYSWLQIALTTPEPQWSYISRKIHAAAAKALAVDPHNVSALTALGVADNGDGDFAGAKEELEAALRLDPSDARARQELALLQPTFAQAVAELKTASRLDPGNAFVQYVLAGVYLDGSDWPHLVDVALHENRLSPHSVDPAFNLAFAYTELHRPEDAVKAFDIVQPETALDQQLVDAGRTTYEALLRPALRADALAALARLRGAPLSHKSSIELVQLYLALGDADGALQLLPTFCASVPVGCHDMGGPFWSPLRDDPRFAKLAKRYALPVFNSTPAAVKRAH